MSNIQIIAIDMDGTMLGREGILSRTTRDALTDATKKGIIVVPCTGRCWDEIPDSFLELEWVRYAILSNGARIVDLKTEKTLYENLIPFEAVKNMLPSVVDTGLVYHLTYEGSIFADDSFMETTIQGMNDAGAGYVELLEKFRFVKNLPAEVYRRKMDVEKLSVRKVEEEKKEQIMSFFRENPGYEVTHFYLDESVPMDIEINGIYCNKATACMALCDMLEIPLEDVMAIGDGHNDVALIQAAGFGIAMSNGCSEVKNAAKYVTLRNDEDGVAVALRKFVLNGERDVTEELTGR